MSNSESERRQYERSDLGCPVSVSTDGSAPSARGRTLNISDGGMLFSMPVDAMPHLRQKVHVRVAVPRTTPNTHMFEDFQLDATVVRHQTMADSDLADVAVQFTEVADLNLEV